MADGYDRIPPTLRTGTPILEHADPAVAVHPEPPPARASYERPAADDLPVIPCVMCNKAPAVIGPPCEPEFCRDCGTPCGSECCGLYLDDRWEAIEAAWALRELWRLGQQVAALQQQWVDAGYMHPGDRS